MGVFELSSDEYNTYLDNLLSGRKDECASLVEELIGRGRRMHDIYVKLFQRSLYDVGSLWEHNRISVASEHLATAVTESLFSLVYPQIFRSERVGKQAVISCVANEFHQIGAKMVADVFELNGWDGLFVGSNTPTDDLLTLVDDKEPDLIGLSLSIYFNLPRLIEIIELINRRFSELRIIVGGQAFRFGGADAVKKFPGVLYVSSLTELEAMIRSETVHPSGRASESGKAYA